MHKRKGKCLPKDKPLFSKCELPIFFPKKGHSLQQDIINPQHMADTWMFFFLFPPSDKHTYAPPFFNFPYAPSLSLPSSLSTSTIAFCHTLVHTECKCHCIYGSGRSREREKAAAWVRWLKENEKRNGVELRPHEMYLLFSERRPNVKCYAITEDRL